MEGLTVTVEEGRDLKEVSLGGKYIPLKRTFQQEAAADIKTLRQ
jgi:hypothetical protein